MKTYKKSEKGTIIGVAMIFLMVMSIVLSSTIKLAITQGNFADDHFYQNYLINLCEAGAEEAMWAHNNDDWTGWSDYGSSKIRLLENFSIGKSKFATIRVLMSDIASGAPRILSEATIDGDSSPSLCKQLEMTFSKRSLHANGLVAKDQITFSGGNVSIDSYNSNDGVYSFLSRNDEGTIGTISVITDALNIGNAKVWGYVATGGSAPDVGPNGEILGEDSPIGVKVDSSRIATDFYADFPLPVAPTPTSPNTSINTDSTIGLSGTESSPEYYTVSSIDIGKKDSLVIAGPTVIIVSGTTDIKGEITILEDASLEVYTDGYFGIGGNGIANLTNKPANLRIYGTNPGVLQQEIKFHGNGALHAAIYAPNATLNVTGGGNTGVVNGAAVAHQIHVTGNYEFHIDEALADDDSGDAGWKLATWRELLGGDQYDMSAYFNN